MSLMYCYAIIIFMVIINSNSFENYRIIDPKFVNCKEATDDDYLCYWNPPNGHPNYLNQKFMDPEDFYLTLYNPYFYFFYHSDIFNDEVISYKDFIEKRDKHLEKKYDLIIPSDYSIMTKNEDKKYTGYCPAYWPKRPQFFVVNRQIAKYCNIYKLMYMYHSEKFVSKSGEIKNNLYKAVPDNILNSTGGEIKNNLHKAVPDNIMNATDIVDIKDVIMQDELDLLDNIQPAAITSIDTKFYKINETEYNALLNLMAFLPKVDEHVAYYLKRYFISVYSLLYININCIRYIVDKEILKIMSKDRVNNLKSPYLMQRECYNCYVIRMKNINVIPFHIDFFKKKYNLFKDDNETKTIFDEFGVNFKEVQHQELQELQEERVGQSSGSG